MFVRGEMVAGYCQIHVDRLLNLVVENSLLLQCYLALYMR